MRKQSMNTASLHRTLIVRLLLAGLAVTLVSAGIVYMVERNGIGELVLAESKPVIERFGNEAATIIMSDGSDRFERINTLAAEYRREHGTNVFGRFVMGRVFDPDGQIAFERRAGDVDGLPGWKELNLEPSIHDEPQYTMRSIRGRSWLSLDFPLRTEDGRNAGSFAALFAISPEILARIDRQVLRTAAAVLLSGIVITLVLYPIILRLMRRLMRAYTNLLQANLQTIQVLGSAIAKRDSDTDAHNFRVTLYAVKLAEEIALGADHIRSLMKGAFLHDVGKIGIPDSILLKPGKLTEDEFVIMRTHVEHGIDIVDRSHWLQDARDVVRCHHEKFDGSGYPAGLRGEAIPVVARIFAIVDVFDALTSKRPYKDPFPYDEALRILEEGRGTHFDPALLDAFAKVARALFDDFAHRDDGYPMEALRMEAARYFDILI